MATTETETPPLDLDALRARVRELYWFHDYEIVPGCRTNGLSKMDERMQHFPIPDDLTGQRVLDVGCAEGYFTYLAESRGASVVSIDSWPREGFFIAHDARRSRAEFRHMSVYDLDPQELGTFDLVLFLGLLYHLKHPMLALERVASVTRGVAIIESETMVHHPAGLTSGATFYEHDGLNNDPSNWWVPLPETLVENVRAAGFPRADITARYGGSRTVVRAEMGPRTAGRYLDDHYVVSLERPDRNAVVGTSFDVSGWGAHLLKPETGIVHVRAAIDDPDSPGTDLGPLHYGAPRGDIGKRFGGRYGNGGFSGRVTLPAGIAPGPHTLYVVVEGEGTWGYRAIPIMVG
jgi:tRNA (mo5U34)-methyltransferase